MGHSLHCHTIVLPRRRPAVVFEVEEEEENRALVEEKMRVHGILKSATYSLQSLSSGIAASATSLLRAGLAAAGDIRVIRGLLVRHDGG